MLETRFSILATSIDDGRSGVDNVCLSACGASGVRTTKAFRSSLFPISPARSRSPSTSTQTRRRASRRLRSIPSRRRPSRAAPVTPLGPSPARPGSEALSGRERRRTGWRVRLHRLTSSSVRRQGLDPRLGRHAVESRRWQDRAVRSDCASDTPLIRTQESASRMGAIARSPTASKRSRDPGAARQVEGNRHRGTRWRGSSGSASGNTLSRHRVPSGG